MQAAPGTSAALPDEIDSRRVASAPREVDIEPSHVSPAFRAYEARVIRSGRGCDADIVDGYYRVGGKPGLDADEPGAVAELSKYHDREGPQPGVKLRPGMWGECHHPVTCTGAAGWILQDQNLQQVQPQHECGLLGFPIVNRMREWLVVGTLSLLRKLALISTGTAVLSALQFAEHSAVACRNQPKLQPRGYSVPLIDLASETKRQIVVDREPGQYLGHPSTVLLEDGQTILVVYPKGHGRGSIVLKRSSDGGLTWSDRLPVPDNWSTSLETPTIHRVVDRTGNRRLIVFSGLFPARMAVSENDGRTWTPLEKIGDWGGIVVMGFVEPARNSPGQYLAMFHDDGRYFTSAPHQTTPVAFTLYRTRSIDGGLTWSTPEAIYSSAELHLCEPGVIRSPDGRQLAIVLRENSRRRNSHVMFSDDEGRTWSNPRELPGALTGDRHVGKYTPDGRLFVSFRDTTRESPTQGDWVAWVGTYEDILEGREGQYRVRLMDNFNAWDCAYPGVEVLPDGTIVTVTYGTWIKGEQPFIACVRLRLEELDKRATGRRRNH